MTLTQSDIYYFNEYELSDYDLKGISESHLDSTICDKKGNWVWGILKVFYGRQ